jgi:hypothetical protein
MNMSDTGMPKTITTIVMDAVGSLAYYKEDVAPLEDGQFFIKTLYSGISAGTELTFFMATNPKHN